MSLLTARFVKNSHIKARIYFICLENVLRKNCNAFKIPSFDFNE